MTSRTGTPCAFALLSTAWYHAQAQAPLYHIVPKKEMHGFVNDIIRSSGLYLGEGHLQARWRGVSPVNTLVLHVAIDPEDKHHRLRVGIDQRQRLRDALA